MQIRQHVGSNKLALVLHPSGRSLTFEQLESRANQLAHFLRRAGLRKGDALAVIMENSEHLLVAMWAARRCGLYYTLLSTHLSAAEAAYVIDNCGAKAIIGSHVTRSLCIAVEQVLAPGFPDFAIMVDADLMGWHRYPDCVADLPETPICDELEGDLLQYSSGTTGRPRGIRRPLPHQSPADTPHPLVGTLSILGIDSESIYLSPAPLYHTAPSYWCMVAQSVGATVVVMEKFSAEGALEAIAQHRVTHGQFVPAMFVRMLKLDDDVRSSYDISSLRRIVHAAAPCPIGIKAQMIDWWGPIVDEFYSSSEGAGICFIRADEWLTHPGSVGKPMLGAAHVVDDDGFELPAGQPGHIHFDGALEFEYLNDESKTATSRGPHGWRTVGDIGYLDRDGYLYLTDRRHHMIISGGVNIYPQETEDDLITHPKVMDAAVFGIPDDEMGQCVKAVVQTIVPSDAHEQFGAELISWLRDRIAHYKCPRSISFESALPRSDAGKLYKQKLVEKYSEPVRSSFGSI
jgi:fatty-acyl-CoA synthase